ncbi:MAG TPA: TraM recognition domain-containing protein [Anaerolineales bacterium]|nr:TraM recognition domain-containing protein [Anaerolineales bacterium]
MTAPAAICPACGETLPPGAGDCLLCTGRWETWELRHPALPIERIAEKFAEWTAGLPAPSAVRISAGADGIRVRLLASPGHLEAAVRAWAALTRGHSAWIPIDTERDQPQNLFGLRSPAILPVLPVAEGDLAVTIGAAVLDLAGRTGAPAVLAFWILGREDALQDRLRALSAYSTGTERGVDDDTPNPWSLRLALWRALMLAGGLVAAGAGAAFAPGWIGAGGAALGLAAGGLAALGGFIGSIGWMRLRSLSPQILEDRLDGPLLRAAITLEAAGPGGLQPLAGVQRWDRMDGPWPDVRRFAFPLPAAHLARVFAPVEGSDLGAILAPDTIQPVPAPSPARALLDAPVPIGRDPRSGRPVGIDETGHTLVVGGSRTGKSSAVYWTLRRLVSNPESAPGLFLVDPHGSLADGLLDFVDRLPEPERTAAVRRLRIVTPGEDFVIPLNPLMAPDFTWAGNALVQAGERIWGEFWGPRMQAALLALARLGHSWNKHNPDRPMGLVHAVFAAYDRDWRAEALACLPEGSRLGAAALDALLGQNEDRVGARNHQWITEVVSPILSKLMSLELSPWLFAALHQAGFVDLEGWVRERAWVVLRLPAGEIGREGARLTAGMVYNIFEAAYRKVTSAGPVPFVFVIDETQEIAQAMQIESLLSEGGKFGARMFVLAQSLSLLRQIEGFEPVVRSLLANTSAQLFFSPDPEDADLIRAALSTRERYGPTTIDVPSLQAWLRARIGGRWQPPALVAVDPLQGADPERVERLIRDVAAAHPGTYVRSGGWQAGLPVGGTRISEVPVEGGVPDETPDPHRLGW